MRIRDILGRPSLAAGLQLHETSFAALYVVYLFNQPFLPWALWYDRNAFQQPWNNTLTKPETQSPISFINLCLHQHLCNFGAQFLAWVRINTEHACSNNTKNFITNGWSSSLGFVMHCIIMGGHNSGILNSPDKGVADHHTTLSHPFCALTMRNF